MARQDAAGPKAWLAGHAAADRGGRVFHPVEQVAGNEIVASGRIVLAGLASRRPAPAKPVLASIPKRLEAQVAAESTPARAVATPADRPQPRSGQAALAELASFEPRPASKADLAATGVAAYQSPDVPRPSLRPAVEAAAAVDEHDLAIGEGAEGEEDVVIGAIPVPAARPEVGGSAGVRVASLEPQDVAPPLGTVTEEMTALAVPLPERRPNYTPQASAEPQPQRQAPQPVQPAQRQAPQPAPAVANTRPNLPGRDNDDSGIGGFFERLFQGGGSAKLPGAGSRIAVYDISSATVYLPGEGKLEAHSGLGHMQDNPRYVDQKMRGPTPPNVYNLRMREARFHGAEAIRLLPADGRKKFNRDGLLAHPYMYIGGGDRSQSNGCVVFKNYDRFLRAFKAGRINRMIVVKSMNELPTYMAAL
nr:tlde1 domain-containing protein [Jiella sonneratiae]